MPQDYTFQTNRLQISGESLDPSNPTFDEDLEELVLSTRRDVAKTICLSSIRREIEFSRPGSAIIPRN